MASTIFTPTISPLLPRNDGKDSIFNFVSLINSFSNVHEFSPIHGQLVTTGYIHDPLITFHALQFLTSVNQFDYSRDFLRKTNQSDAKVWNFVLEKQLRLDVCSKQVLLTYCCMVRKGVVLDVTTFHYVLQACCKSLDVTCGSEIHGRILKYGLGGYRSLKNNLMGLYSKGGKVEQVRKLFENFDDRNVISWNTMISCYVNRGFPEEALDLYREMMVEGVRPDEITMISLVSACTKLKNLSMGEELHLYIEINDMDIGGSLLNCLVDMYIKCGEMEKAERILEDGKGYESDDVVLRTTILSGYVKSGKIIEARRHFEQMTRRNLISWTTMISGYVQQGLYYESLELFRQMRFNDVMPDEVTLITALSASAHTDDFYFGGSVHSLVIKYGMTIDGFLGNTLVDLYAKYGKLDDARTVFKQLATKTIVSWNSMLDALCQSGDISDAKIFFDEIPYKDVVTWNIIIKCYANSHQFEQVCALFREMQASGFKPDKPTLLSLLSSCACAGALDHGIWVHAYIKKNCIKLLDHMLSAALIDMYGKCGSIEKAYETFCEVTEKNIYLWTTIITAFAMQGNAEKAVQLFSEMEAARIKPDHITFIALLSACSQGGFVDEGYEYFNKMSSIYKLTPRIQHYGCMVDLLTRAGQLEEAVEFIESMRIKPDSSIWSSVLRACEIYQNVKLAEHAFKHLIEINPQTDSAYVLLANIYAHAGRWEDVSRTRKALKDIGVQKLVGCSLIEHHGKIREFTAADFSDPQSAEVYAMLDEVKQRLQNTGFQEASSYHSEKLAVAYGLLTSPEGTPIRIVNNLRICTDCHSVMKMISHVYSREIVIRDNYRFHKFQDGVCSCKDYW